MKKKFAAAALAGICLLTFASCGEKMYANSESSMAEQSYKAGAESWGGDAAWDDYAGEYTAESEESYADDNYDYKRSDMETNTAEYKQASVRAIDRQMLVYSCDMSIDVLEFDASVDKFHDLINKYQGFIESETYSDGGSSSKWQYADEQKWKTLNTVIRIPSASYDNFCKDAEKVGDMRRKNASVQNLSTEYSDLKTTLSIYEAKEKRYIDMLADMKDESEAVAVENELTNIQIEIARIKTRMNNIENDVAYSYINLTVNEVREYSEEPVIEKTDTFGQRLVNTLSRTWKGFLEFLEGLLFLIIRLLPYLLMLGIFLFVIIKICKTVAKKKKAARAAVQPIQPVQPPVQMPEQPVQPDTAETAENAKTEEPQADKKTKKK